MTYQTKCPAIRGVDVSSAWRMNSERKELRAALSPCIRIVDETPTPLMGRFPRRFALPLNYRMAPGGEDPGPTSLILLSIVPAAK
jgi:hypothetical protein